MTMGIKDLFGKIGGSSGSDKKSIVLLIFLSAVVFLLWWFLGGGVKNENFPDSISGKVVEVRGDILKVEGYLNVAPELKRVVTREFKITEKTKFRKTELLLRSGNHKPGEAFTPETRESEGALSDLKYGVRIDTVRGDSDLNSSGTPKALEVNYSLMVF